MRANNPKQDGGSEKRVFEALDSHRARERERLKKYQGRGGRGRLGTREPSPPLSPPTSALEVSSVDTGPGDLLWTPHDFGGVDLTLPVEEFKPLAMFPTLSVDLALAECGIPLDGDCSLNFDFACDLGGNMQCSSMPLDFSMVDINDPSLLDTEVDWEKELADFDWNLGVLE
ncbi:hypothetical protein HIM_11831 [Hirsutella minnesotensis 3608]|uniref:Uncharacterized protein n=1 Tax=Hirsutella minnesotensis 3608 TaxID=1043627 RepID=A0A0F8A0R2_9HYPO|nr:hypothetical protein HIM_11831 [Hirsutella minnesotensis 3608]